MFSEIFRKSLSVTLLLVTVPVLPASRIPLTLDYAVDLAMTHSVRILRLKLSIDRNTYWLKARKAGLKSRVYANLKSPDLQNISDTRWNSVLYRDEIVHLNTQMWQSELSIKQPVILFGYPTNGYLSLNYKLYRYQQNENGNHEIDYYNRLYVQLEQPFFLPNELKNDLEEAELNLRDIQLEYISERMDILNDIADDYYDAFALAYRVKLFREQMHRLDEIREITEKNEQSGQGQRKDHIQTLLEIANVRENLLETKSRLRMELMNMKQRLGIDSADSLVINPEVQLNPVKISLDHAVRNGCTLNPHLKRLNISKQKAEIDVENIKGWNAFYMKLQMTYGLEKSNHNFNDMWMEYENSNSITLNAYVPLWDWGKHRYEILASQKLVDRRMLDIDERKQLITNEIRMSYTNLNEYRQRFENMEESVTLAHEITGMALDDYRQSGSSLQDLLQIVNRQTDTGLKLLDAYLGYKRAWLALLVQTYYDFEASRPVQELWIE